jgi:hypothetical protein
MGLETIKKEQQKQFSDPFPRVMSTDQIRTVFARYSLIASRRRHLCNAIGPTDLTDMYE